MNSDRLFKRAESLKLYGLLSHWDEVSREKWPEQLLRWEEQERSNRSLQRRLDNAKLDKFKMMSDFDWDWPRKCDRTVIEEWISLKNITQPTNLILYGSNGAGKTMMAKNIAYEAILKGHTALFVTAGEMLSDIAKQESDSAMSRRIKHYARPHLLVIDEVGYLSYSNRHADLLFEIVTRRYESKPTIVTTNIKFEEWPKMFPNAACVVTLIDRLIHHSDIVAIDADSYRQKEAAEKCERRKQETRKNKVKS